MIKKQWFLIENSKNYQKATKRFEEIQGALLAFLINQYEERLWDIPELDPIEMIKIRMEDFGYNSSGLANEYGDKGTISKVINYKQPLSPTMGRKFSKMLRLPSAALTKEYQTI